MFKKTDIDDLYLIEIKKYGDSRGYFEEVYNQEEFNKAGLKYKFVQDNQSHSKKGVIRGLHFQKTFPQAKLVRVIDGEVYDVAVDLRKDSRTYGKWYGVNLSSDNNVQLMIPRGFAHGFQVISEEATFCYKCDEFYHPEDETGIMWNDKDLAINWPIKDHVIISDKDKQRPSFKEIYQ